METLVKDYLEGIVLGEMQAFEGLAAFPLHHPEKGGPRYLTLQEALRRDLLLITEKSDEGSVPELAVANRADRPVLLLDGEELVGAKQNRVLNTSVLVAAGAEMVIPVSCTEAGRWSYRSDRFESSPDVLFHSARREKAMSVSCNLVAFESYRSDQGRVWENIDRLACSLGASSPTSAMRDVIGERERDIAPFLEAVEPLHGQKGLLVFIGGEVAGMDIVSRSEAYAELHPKLLRSYAVDALAGQSPRRREPSFEAARAFLEEAAGCGEEKYRSAGLGWDHRFAGPGVVGTALAWRRRVIHAAFFRTWRRGQESGMGGGVMRDFRARRHFREI